MGKKLDDLFKNAKSSLKVANKVIKQATENLDDLKRMIDSIDDWTYLEVPKRIQDEVSEFIRKKIGIQ